MLKLLGDTLDTIKQLMGNSQSQFVAALKRGDTSAATQIYCSKKTLRESIKPNETLNGDLKENSILHYVASLSLYPVYEDMLNSGRAFPDQKNSDRRNCLHLICQGHKTGFEKDMLLLTFSRGLCGMDLKHVLSEQDSEGNTALHLAAMTGLDDCVELLIEKGAELSTVNSAKETPADLALKKGFRELATKLETKVVFEDDDPCPPVEPDPEELEEIASGTKGLRDNELRSMKDQLLIETSNMLGVPLLTAQVLLKDHDWSKEVLLEAWVEDPAQVCEKSGVDLPLELGAHHLDQECVSHVGGEDVRECAVCYLTTPLEVVVPCQHHFCKDCWKQYLEDKIKSGESHKICCPEYGCYRPVPLGVIERVVSPEMARKFLSFDIKAFVDSNPNIRWCPIAGCGQAVSLTTDPTSLSSAENQVTVHCGNDHYFCWACLRGPHDPCSCEVWTKWLDYVEEMRPKVGNTTAAEADEAASSRWLADRSKPCPKCRSPIEKTEGCNHMCCKKCKHDFCWVCLDNWKCHNSSTGGYFECNRYDAQKKAASLLEKRRDSYYGNARELEAVSRFLHYYERYKEHLNSLALEEPFLDKARDKMQQLARSVPGLEGGDMSFIEDAVRELLKCRRVLQATYPYAYYLSTRKRREFERLQGSLEQVTEMLAEVVARPHLRKPRSEIIRLTHEARTKRRLLLESKERMDKPSPPFPRRHAYNDADSDIEDSDITAFLRMFERKPLYRSHDPPPRSHDQTEDQSQEDDDLLRVLELSKHEFEADRQLKEDIDMAKAQSIAAAEATPTTLPLTLMEPVTPTFDPEATPTESDWISRLNSNREPTSWPVLRLNTPPPSPPPRPYTPPTTHDENEWGPLISEEEDLEQAIQLSLQQQGGGRAAMMDVVGPQVIDSNKLAEGHLYGLPPELQHLLDTRRTGEHV